MIRSAAIAALLALTVASLAVAEEKPDFTGTYDVKTLTPLVRPAEFGDSLELTREDAERIMREAQERREARSANRGPVTEAPPEGGAPPIGIGDEFRETSGAGNVGGYNDFWVDSGDEVFDVDGKFRTSIIVDPENGQYPPPTEAAIERLVQRRKLRRPNDGTAWWLDVEGPGPYDGPESLGISERCVIGFTGAAPTYPSLYNNYKRIVQTDDYLMIEIEMVHDARIVRMNSEHPPKHIRSWLGDSIGWWEDDTLVIETTNFHPLGNMRSGGPDATITERFSKLENGDLLYRFTVDDPEMWTAAWTGEFTWRQTEDKLFEYACHEGNYSMEGILKGARLLEEEKRAQSSGD
ncbi:MAG: hypothetical protein AAGK22_00845 [Acidobacteriota bacterium]